MQAKCQKYDLTNDAMDKLQGLYTMGLVGPGDLDDETLTSLSRFSAALQLEILEKFSEVDLTAVQRKRGFLQGIMRRYRAKDLNPKQNNGQPCPEAARRLEELMATNRLSAGELEVNILQALAQLPPVTQMEVLDKFSEVDLTQMRNKSGFLAGIIKRFAGTSALLAAPPMLNAAAQARIDQLIQAGQLGQGELQNNALQLISKQPAPLQLEIIEKFAEADLTSMRNKTAYLMGVVKRYQNQMTGLDQAQLDVVLTESPAVTLATQLQQASMPSRMPAETSWSMYGNVPPPPQANLYSPHMHQAPVSDTQLASPSPAAPLPSALQTPPPPPPPPATAFASAQTAMDGETSGPTTPPKATLDSLTDAAGQQPGTFWQYLELVFLSGKLTQQDFDVQLVTEFSLLKQSTAIEILQKYCEADLSQVHDRKSFLRSIISRYSEGGSAEILQAQMPQDVSNVPPAQVQAQQQMLLQNANAQLLEALQANVRAPVAMPYSAPAMPAAPPSHQHAFGLPEQLAYGTGYMPYGQSSDHLMAQMLQQQLLHGQAMPVPPAMSAAEAAVASSTAVAGA
eukprot:NODE_354_length_2049_cov_50.690427_g348_i0.p1 GENE.NODE_354_length_2049_cov_50.690427_g348_i0~~NODE_354_length_2049_cov_50.690427_g348_i0.p1  ORF type:complete len:568 (+),score=117.50 NODE_354_length_2049_cov_50.690427_g348_i0:72-1775(+)